MSDLEPLPIDRRSWPSSTGGPAASGRCCAACWAPARWPWSRPACASSARDSGRRRRDAPAGDVPPSTTATRARPSTRAARGGRLDAAAHALARPVRVHLRRTPCEVAAPVGTSRPRTPVKVVVGEAEPDRGSRPRSRSLLADPGDPAAAEQSSPRGDLDAFFSVGSTAFADAEALAAEWGTDARSTSRCSSALRSLAGHPAGDG